MFTRQLSRTAIPAFKRSFSTTARLFEQSEFIMPALSPTMTEGKISSWLVKEGSSFTAGQPLLQIETDKAQMDVEAADDGVVAKILADQNTGTIAIGTTIAIFVEEGDDISSITIPEQTQVKPLEPVETTKPASTEPPASTEKTQKPQEPKKNALGSPMLSPSARYLINAKQISNVDKITGTGHRGHIIKFDVVDFINKGLAEYSKSPQPSSSMASPEILGPNDASKPTSKPAKSTSPKSAPASSTNSLANALYSSTVSNLQKQNFINSISTKAVKAKNLPKVFDAKFGVDMVKQVSNVLLGNKSVKEDSNIALYLTQTDAIVGIPSYIFPVNDVNSQTPEELLSNAARKSKNLKGDTILSVIFNYESQISSDLMGRSVILIGTPFHSTFSNQYYSRNSVLDSALDQLTFAASSNSVKTPAGDIKSKKQSNLAKSVNIYASLDQSVFSASENQTLNKIGSTISNYFA
ncbi:hypothetical protein BB560_003112 [Smittium megazygosporum]|uniref:Lipoyl-binding domain-containing protein n=1 Tax=Smittium megazygosporum TaxID=133381 RepID=A0A2T9ZD17_9FUNG|nr:hypothetical protein BB560_003112 [Smittium megazygosporum]